MLDEIVTNTIALPASTPAVVPYPNLVDSTQVSLHQDFRELISDIQFKRNNFKPRKRTFERVPSAQENEFALKKILKECQCT